MSVITVIHGSPVTPSRSSALADALVRRLLARGHTVEQVAVRTLHPDALVGADAADESVRTAVAKVAQATAVIFATPVYKGAYSGLLKLFIDLLPQDALAGRVALPLATGGVPAHFMALDYALKPVLAALGARSVLAGVFATDAELARDAAAPPALYGPTAERVERAFEDLVQTLQSTWGSSPLAASSQNHAPPRLAVVWT